MNNNTASGQGGPNANTTIQHAYQMGMKVAQAVCSIVTAPVEYALRPSFGTRYFDPIQMIFTYVFMACLTVAGSAGSYLPFGTTSASDGLIGIGTLSLLFFASHIVHGPRVWRRMIEMEREQHSEFEGDALPFFARLPYGRVFWLVRIVHEPLFVTLAAIALHLVYVLNRPAMTYLLVGALLLSVKNVLAWYQSWLYLRILMDGKFVAPLVAKAASGTATERELAQVHLAGFPKSLPADVRMAAIAQLTPPSPSLPPEIAQLLSPIDRPEVAQAA